MYSIHTVSPDFTQTCVYPDEGHARGVGVVLPKVAVIYWRGHEFTGGVMQHEVQVCRKCKKTWVMSDLTSVTECKL